MRKSLIFVLPFVLIANGQAVAQTAPTAKERDLAECKMDAMRLGNWDRDSWYVSTATGQYLMACMTAKGYRRRTIDYKEAYNPLDEVIAKKKPLYRSGEAEFLIRSGCFDNHEDTVNIAIAECWQK
jgi:hypothetical protein